MVKNDNRNNKKLNTGIYFTIQDLKSTYDRNLPVLNLNRIH